MGSSFALEILILVKESTSAASADSKASRPNEELSEQSYTSSRSLETLLSSTINRSQCVGWPKCQEQARITHSLPMAALSHPQLPRF